MKRVLIFIFLICILACVPTPDSSAIIGKDSDAISAMLLKTAEEPFVMPDAFPAEWEIGLEHVHVSCVASPQTDLKASFPIIKVKELSYTDEDAYTVLHLFTDEDAVYPGLFEGMKTKEQLARQRTNLQTFLDGENPTDALKTLLQSMLENEIEPQLETAPITLPEPVNAMEALREKGSFVFEKDGYWYQLIRFRHSNELIVTVCETTEQNEALAAQGNAMYWEEPNTGIEPEISMGQAIEIGNAAIRPFDRSDLLRLSTAQKGRLLDHWFYGTEYKLSEGWILYYMIDAGALTGCSTDDGILSEERQYMPPWAQLRVKLYVDGQGVRSVACQGLCARVETVNDNAAVLSFSKILPYFCEQLKYRFAYDADGTETPVETNVVIDALRLESALIAAPNEPDYGYYVPAWHIRYTYFVGSDPTPHVGNIVLNAIDGSRLITEYIA